MNSKENQGKQAQGLERNDVVLPEYCEYPIFLYYVNHHFLRSYNHIINIRKYREIKRWRLTSIIRRAKYQIASASLIRNSSIKIDEEVSEYCAIPLQCHLIMSMILAEPWLRCIRSKMGNWD